MLVVIGVCRGCIDVLNLATLFSKSNSHKSYTTQHNGIEYLV